MIRRSVIYFAAAILLCWAAVACGQGWVVVPPIRQSGISGLLGELEDRMPAEHIYRDADLVTWAHETTHGLNSRIRNQYGGNTNAVYLYGAGAIVIPEPPVTLSQVAANVPASERRRCFQLYMVDQRADWDGQPLYVLDEMVAYLNGALVGYEWGDRSRAIQSHENAVEMYHYARVLHSILKPGHPSRYDLRPLNDFLAQIHVYLQALVPYATQDVAEIRWGLGVGGGMQCGPGGCSSGACPPPRTRFTRPMPQFPRRQPIVRQVPRQPDLPMVPVVDEPTLDPPLVPIPQQPHNHDEINAKLEELAKMISEIPAGRTGDTGQQGARGLQGEPGVPGVCDPSTFTDEQVAALVKRLPPIHVEVEILDSPPEVPQLKQDVRLGGTLPLRLYLMPPKKQ